jgi:hypothetical protein
LKEANARFDGHLMATLTAEDRACQSCSRFAGCAEALALKCRTWAEWAEYGLKMTNQKVIQPVGLTIAVTCFLSAAAGIAATVDTAGVAACALSGWSNDPDPAGLNIRAAPRADAEIIGRVPPPEEQAGDSYSAEFGIIGSRNGWFLINSVKFRDYGSGKGDRVLFGGPGWVFADKVRFLINRAEVRGAPAETAPVLAKLQTPDGIGGPDSANIDHVFGCSGTFAEATVHMEGQRQTRGWVTGICSNQVTTCP